MIADAKAGPARLRDDREAGFGGDFRDPARRGSTDAATKVASGPAL